MDRLISLEPSNVVAIRVDPGQRCSGELTLRNVMYTMPVAFRLQPINKTRYTVKPHSGIISPLATVTVEITYQLAPGLTLPESFPYCDDSFLLHSVVVPGAAIKDAGSALDTVPSDWFTTRKKQVFIDSGIKVMFLGSQVISRLVLDGNPMEEIRDVLERSDPLWKTASSVDSKGRTMLHVAIGQSRADLVQLLLEFGASVEARSQSGSTPLEAASASGETLISELLLARGAATERAEDSSLGPSHLAAGNGHVEILKLLLSQGANIDALTKDGNTALHIAVEERRRDCVRVLLSSGARTDIGNSEDADTALHIAARSGDEQLVRLLLHKGANKDVRNRFGKTAYDVAAEHGHVRLFDALRLGDKLCRAASQGDVRMIQRLLEHGAGINGRDQHGWTALHRAAFKGWSDAVRALIDKGIEVDAKDEDGYTALHCSVESGHLDVVELLVKKGADKEARTNKGVIAVQIAESLNYSGIVRFLGTGSVSREGTGLFRGSIKGATVREVDTKSLKKKHGRTRALRTSFDRPSRLPVVAVL